MAGASPPHVCASACVRGAYLCKCNACVTRVQRPGCPRSNRKHRRQPAARAGRVEGGVRRVRPVRAAAVTVAMHRCGNNVWIDGYERACARG